MNIIGGTYVVGDIHGRFEAWMEMKNRIEKEDPEAKFIFVGDIEDRGPESYEMIVWAMENITDDGKYQMVKGNHEDGKVEWWERVKKYIKYTDDIDKNDFDYSYAYPNEHYGFNHYMWYAGVRSYEMDHIINWMDNLPYYKDIVVNNKRFIIVHADAPRKIFNVDGKIKENIPDFHKSSIIWEREKYTFNAVENTILIHGHTPSIFPEAFPYWYEDYQYEFGEIVKMENRINIDCGAGYFEYNNNANLAILRLDDFKEYYLYNRRKGRKNGK